MDLGPGSGFGVWGLGYKAAALSPVTHVPRARKVFLVYIEFGASDPVGWEPSGGGGCVVENTIAGLFVRACLFEDAGTTRAWVYATKEVVPITKQRERARGCVCIQG